MSGNIIQLNEDFIKNNLKDLVRDSVEETLNALLDHEADELVRAGKYERTGDRKGYRSGHYERNFGTTSGEVELRMSKRQQCADARLCQTSPCCRLRMGLEALYGHGTSIQDGN